ncbi:MAG TPA: MerR family transcriptional regulator [Candidatus Babeliales bacterium]|nr:MerR family transcriptional regulator [Candidatus Babeliales bacterium]
MKIKRKQGFFSISAVAKMFSVHQQTVRLYEKQGLINPKRSEGNTRLFSEEDIDRLEEIIYLTHELGINLAGVEVIFKLKKQIKKMQQDMNKVFEKAQQNLDEHTEESKQTIQRNVKQLMKMQKESPVAIQPLTPVLSGTDDEESAVELETWEVEYED